MNAQAPLASKVKGILLVLLLLVLVIGALKLSFPFPYRDTIKYWSDAYAVDPYLIAAVIRTESHFRPHAVSSVGAIGLMQIMPATGAWIAAQLGETQFEVTDLYTPAVNLRYGTWYLSYLIERFAGDALMALRAYNAGPSNVERWQGGDSPFPATEAYVRGVESGWKGYRAVYLFPVIGTILKLIPV